MNPGALVPRGHIRQAMGGFEPQFLEDFHGAPSITRKETMSNQKFVCGRFMLPPF
jgi:hypothetical protein